MPQQEAVPAGQLLSHGDGHGILETGAAQLDHIFERFGPFGHGFRQHIHGLDHFQNETVGGQQHGRGQHIIGGLSHVHMGIGMHFHAVQQHGSPVGQNLVEVHMDADAAAAGDHVHRELIVQFPGQNLIGCHANGPGPLFIQGADLLIGQSRRLFDAGHGPDHFHAVLTIGVAGDVGVLHAPHRLYAVIRLILQLHLAEEIVLDSHGYPPLAMSLGLFMY